MKITGLKTNYQNNPLGIDLSDLTFTWQVEGARGSRAQKARLLIAGDSRMADVVFDSDKDDPYCHRRVPSFGYTPRFAAVPAMTYFWKVIVTDDAGDTAESAAQHFEGGHPEGDWMGKWIRPEFTSELHPVMRKEFTLSEDDLDDLAKARLYICGLGLYEAYINGEKVGNQFLTPYFTDYRYWTEYQTYDIAPYLRAGENTIDVWLGNGWYKGRFGYLANGQLREYYGDEFKLLADLYFRKQDGSSYIIGTDESWQALKSPVVISGIYDGEVYDARKETALERPTARDISMAMPAAAPAAKLLPMVGVPVTAHEVHKPIDVITTPKGEKVLDFGQEVTGWVEFTANTPADTRIVLEYGEVLQNGNFYRDNLRTATARYTYISAGNGTKRARAHFTFYGFRYVRVSGVDISIENMNDYQAVSLYSDLEETGFITTGNEKVNRLIANTKWSEKDNFVDIPTDCPQRDEREGWTGDAQIFSGTASYHMETPVFFRKYLKDMAYEQQEKNGAVPYVVPDVLTIGREKMAEPPYDMSVDEWGEAGAAVWGDAAVIIPWNMYLHFGNKKMLEEEYSNMKQWVDFIRYMDDTYCGGKRLWTCGFHFGDWLSLDVEGDAAGMDNREGGTDKYFVASMYYMYSAELTARAAALLGKDEEATAYGRLSQEVRRAVREQYVTGEGELSIHSQTAYILGIHFHIFDGAEGMKKGGDRLEELIHQWNDHLATGFVGTGYIMEALTETGHVRDAYTLLLNEDYPSWLYEVNLGATTTWERWNSLLPDGSVSGTGMNSLNHYAYGCVCEWIYDSVCGLRVTQYGTAAIKKDFQDDLLHPTTQAGVGGASMVIAPHTDQRLKWAKARVRFAAGVYTSSWRLADNDRIITYEFSVPFDASAQFVPDLDLYDVTINGKRVTATAVAGEPLYGRTFLKGDYRIEARY